MIFKCIEHLKSYAILKEESMELIREIYGESINKENIYESNPDYRARSASRAIVFNELNRIAILNVSKDKYHKLPGGGIEENEGIMDALKRELLEEVGVHVEILGEVGIIVEYRNNFKQTSYCYAAKVVGELKETSFTEEEINDGFILEWHTLDEAIDLMEGDVPQSLSGKFIRERDLTFIKHLKNNLNLNNEEK
jgi:8-oxo-dGTP diphosphatase